MNSSTFLLHFRVIDMSTKRQVKIFSAGCALCQDLIETIRNMACSACEVEVLDLIEQEVIQQARTNGISSAPAVVVDGEPITCCEQNGPDEDQLRAAGIGTSVE